MSFGLATAFHNYTMFCYFKGKSFSENFIFMELIKLNVSNGSLQTWLRTSIAKRMKHGYQLVSVIFSFKIIEPLPNRK